MDDIFMLIIAIIQDKEIESLPLNKLKSFNMYLSENQKVKYCKLCFSFLKIKLFLSSKSLQITITLQFSLGKKFGVIDFYFLCLM